MRPHRCVEPRPGESAPFHLESTWTLGASPREAWEEFARLDAWPAWWPRIAEAALMLPNDADHARAIPGARARVRIHSPLGRGLEATMVLRELRAPWFAHVDVGGDLRGTGTWRARPAGDATRADIVWCVTTRNPLIRALRPLGGTAHARVMAAGEAGLNARLSA